MPRINKNFEKNTKPAGAQKSEEKKPAGAHKREEKKPAGAHYGQKESGTAGFHYGQEDEDQYSGPIRECEWKLAWDLYGKPSTEEKKLARGIWEAQGRADRALERAKEAEERLQQLWRVVERALPEIDHLREVIDEKEIFIKDLLKHNEYLSKKAWEEYDQKMALIDLND